MVDYSKLLKNRRAIRHYGEEPVSPSLIGEIIEESCLAPSSGNGQPWQFVVIADKGMMARISDESKANLLADLEANPDLPIKQYAPALKVPDFNVFYNAPALVIIAGDSAIRSIHVDCALVAAYFMFSAVERGLGTCWVDLGGNIRSPEILAQLGLTPAHRIIAPIIVGYPTMIPDPPHRKGPEILKIIS
jgi:nitroreductase